MPGEQQFNDLLKNYLSDTASPEEYIQLMQMIKGGEYDDELKAMIDQSFNEDATDKKLNTDRAHELLYKIMSAEKRTDDIIPQKKTPVKKIWIRIAAAAAIIIAFFSAGYLLLNQSKKNDRVNLAQQKQVNKTEILPGGNKAVLTLSNGSVIVLDDASNGTLSRQGNSKVIKADGQLSYAPANTQLALNEVLYNTVSTPRGGQYQVTLPDGTIVWLNAASSLKFPTSFTGKDRRVDLTGEAYFEVAKNKEMPFKVNINGKGEVEVLGTHFNINSYDDEAYIRTTLLEGSVRVSCPPGNGVESKSRIETVIQPGDEAAFPNLPAGAGGIQIKSVNVEDAIAWKNGKFNFNGTNITAIMRQVSRWYDVDINYEGNMNNLDFSGIISRQENVTQLLKFLESTGTVNFKIEGKKITVSPQQ